MKQILIVRKGNLVIVKKFDTVTEAYHHYLKNYSTFGEWWYYLKCAHKLLNRVTDEQIMECVFRNVFNPCVCLMEGRD